MAMSIPVLPLENMHERHHGLTKPIADAYREAASVCLGKHHVAPQEFSLRAGGNGEQDPCPVAITGCALSGRLGKRDRHN
jgi:hypothetical protein